MGLRRNESRRGVRFAAILIAASAFACSAGCSRPAKFPPADSITFNSSDGTKVYAKLVKSAQPHVSCVVLMFHQAGSSLAEYATIAPRVAAMGFDCLAVDLRSGGSMFGVSNQTAEQFSGKQSYETAYLDMQAAFRWARAEKKYKRIIVWGSSYSASLVLELASQNPGKIAAVLSFSPGEYFSDKSIVASWAGGDNAPTLIACTPDEAVQGRQQIFDALPKSNDNVFVHESGGVHGSSTLIPDRNPNSNGKYWLAVQTFLKPFEP